MIGANIKVILGIVKVRENVIQKGVELFNIFVYENSLN